MRNCVSITDKSEISTSKLWDPPSLLFNG